MGQIQTQDIYKNTDIQHIHNNKDTFTAFHLLKIEFRFNVNIELNYHKSHYETIFLSYKLNFMPSFFSYFHRFLSFLLADSHIHILMLCKSLFSFLDSQYYIVKVYRIQEYLCGGVCLRIWFQTWECFPYFWLNVLCLSFHNV